MESDIWMNEVSKWTSLNASHHFIRILRLHESLQRLARVPFRKLPHLGTWIFFRSFPADAQRYVESFVQPLVPRRGRGCCLAHLYPVDALGDDDDLPKRFHERVVEVREPLVRPPAFYQFLRHEEAARIPVDFRRQGSHDPVGGVHEQVRHAEGELKPVLGVTERDDAEHEHEGADER